MLRKQKAISAEFYFERGCAQQLEGNHEGAIESFTQALAVDPLFIRALLWRGSSYRTCKRTLEAFIDFDRAVTLSPQQGEAYLARGNIYASLRQPDLAFADYCKAIELCRNRKNRAESQIAEVAYVNRATLYREKRRFQEALADLQAALAINNGNIKALINRAILYRVMEEYRVAQQAFDDILSLRALDRNSVSDAELRTVRLERSMVHLRLGYPELTVADCNLALQNASAQQRARLLSLRGNAELHRRSLAPAAEDFTLLIGLNPNEPAYYIQRALAYLYQGQRIKSRRDLEKALCLPGPGHAAHLFLGMLSEEEGRADEARGNYKTFLQQSAGNDLLRLCVSIRLFYLTPDEERTQLLGGIINFRDQIAARPVKRAEADCILALAQQVTGQEEACRQTCQSLLGSFLLCALPLYLQRDFIRMLAQLPPGAGWPECAAVGQDVPALKDQLKDMILSHPEWGVNAALQALCSNTFLGSIFYVKRHSLSSPSIAAGRLRMLAEWLEKKLVSFHPEDISETTRQALREEARINADFAKSINAEFPRLHGMIMAAAGLSRQSRQVFRLFSRSPVPPAPLTPDFPSIQGDDGNRFITHL
ncbi:Lipopolysaccharide assembly protein B [Aquicella siphonis]|uniref:Lipopolysaccharide assembly protein B n=1 Tax=Aquicella siphonis TaxID=254247 RepID=A0A5E4PHU7_9COXI|nr:tetratricopeptide repeat protein [Aquicella siphonis]VVC76589.1 Lipopolysaccharide assembly protein B [Aquicella siphonis]